jgi:hypothetical protein
MIEKPKPEKLFSWGTAARRLYEAMYWCGEVTNAQIATDLHILAYSGVISRIRKSVQPFGLDVAKKRIGHGLFAYRLAVRS